MRVLMKLNSIEISNNYGLETGNRSLIHNKYSATPTATADNNWYVSSNCPSADASGQRTYTMIFYPQTVSGALTFTATISSQQYKNSADIKFDNNNNNKLSAGTSYTFTITIKKTGLAVSGCTIEGWGTAVTGSGEATMQS